MDIVDFGDYCEVHDDNEPVYGTCDTCINKWNDEAEGSPCYCCGNYSHFEWDGVKQ